MERTTVQVPLGAVGALVIHKYNHWITLSNIEQCHSPVRHHTSISVRVSASTTSWWVDLQTQTHASRNIFQLSQLSQQETYWDFTLHGMKDQAYCFLLPNHASASMMDSISSCSTLWCVSFCPCKPVLPWSSMKPLRSSGAPSRVMTRSFELGGLLNNSCWQNPRPVEFYRQRQHCTGFPYKSSTRTNTCRWSS